MSDEPRARLSRWDHWYRRALPTYWVFLFCVSHFPKLDLGVKASGADKVAHFVAFAILAFLLWRFVESFQRPLGPRFVWIALVVLAAYGVVDELLQPTFGRSADVVDWIGDVCGAGVTLALLEWNRRRQARRARRSCDALDSNPPLR